MNNWQPKFLNITWPELIRLTHELGRKLAATNRQFDLLIAIARGGLTISQLLSDQLGLPIAAFTVESYRDLKQTKLPHITHGLSSSLVEKKILLVDDVCDSGKTFLRGLAYLKELGATKNMITTAALHYKAHAEYKPDYYVHETSAWIIYPYEVKETIQQLTPVWRKEGIGLTEIKKRFLDFGFPENQVTEFIGLARKTAPIPEQI